MEFIYKEASLKSGIYKITNKLNGRFYIGSCKCFKKRWYQHKRELENKNHKNQFFQHDFNKCGSDAFTFEVIEIIEGKNRQLRLDVEQKFLDQYWDGCKQCYNMSKWAINHGGSHTPEETRKKLAEAQRGRKHSEESKKKMSEAHKGKKYSSEIRQEMSKRFKGKNNPNYGKKMSEEQKKKISNTKKGTIPWNKGKRLSDEAKGINHYNYGKHHTEETKEKMKKAVKNRKPISEETRKKMSEAQRKRFNKNK